MLRLLDRLTPLEAEDAIATLEVCYAEQQRYKKLVSEADELGAEVAELGPARERIQALRQDVEDAAATLAHKLGRVRDLLQRIEQQHELEAMLRRRINQSLTRMRLLELSVGSLREELDQVMATPVPKAQPKLSSTQLVLLPFLLATLLVLPDALFALIL